MQNMRVEDYRRRRNNFQLRSTFDVAQRTHTHIGVSYAGDEYPPVFVKIHFVPTLFTAAPPSTIHPPPPPTIAHPPVNNRAPPPPPQQSRTPQLVKMTRKDSKLKLQDLGLDLRLVSLDFGLDSGLACLDSGLDSGLEGKDLRLTYDLQNNDLVPPLPVTYLRESRV